MENKRPINILTAECRACKKILPFYILPMDEDDRPSFVSDLLCAECYGIKNELLGFLKHLGGRKILVEEMKKLTNEQRYEITSNFCRSCGDLDPTCQCDNDD